MALFGVFTPAAEVKEKKDQHKTHAAGTEVGGTGTKVGRDGLRVL